jgi:hypothetical protein
LIETFSVSFFWISYERCGVDILKLVSSDADNVFQMRPRNGVENNTQDFLHSNVGDGNLSFVQQKGANPELMIQD